MRFRDLGPLLVDRNGHQRTPGGGRPAAALSLLLIHANRRVGCEALMEAMWGDRAGRRSPSTLESHLSRLRAVVEPGRRPGEPPSVVLSEAAGYRLAVIPDQVDSIRFARLTTSATELLASGHTDAALQCTEEALTLWRGRPYTPVADTLWAAPAVSRLEELYAQAREIHVDALLAAGRPGLALAELEPLIREQPLRERLWDRRMTALHHCGRTNQALATYRQARDLFREEIGAEPGPRLRELHRRLLEDSGAVAGWQASRPLPSAQPRPPSPLPPRLTPLVGRSRELQRLLAVLRTARCLTVTGAAGCGKTRMAVQLARTARAEFPGGTRFVDLADVDAASVADTVSAVVGIDEPAAGGLRGVGDRRPWLVVLDNCDHVLDTAARLTEVLLAEHPRLTVLATAREPLGTDGEVCWPLSPLRLPEPGQDVAGLAATPAVALFVERVTAADPGVTVDGDALGFAAVICRALDGLPLAIELAAARARAYSFAEIAAQVTADASGLARTRRGPVARHDSMRSAVEWGHCLLTDEEKILHRRLSVFLGPFTAPAAATVAGSSPLSRGEVRDLLVRLVYRSFIVPISPLQQEEPSQFAQLSTVRAHAAHALAAADETGATHAAHARWLATSTPSRQRRRTSLRTPPAPQRPSPS